MSFQWSIIAGFLYLEIGFAVLLLIPFVSAQLWFRVFHPIVRRLMKIRRARHYAQFAFFTLLTILTLACYSSYNDVSKYSRKLDELMGQNPEGEMRMRLKLFRAQRNFYITGFALLLSAINRRLLKLIASELNPSDGEANKVKAENENELAKKVKTLQSEADRLAVENKELKEKLKEAKVKASE